MKTEFGYTAKDMKADPDLKDGSFTVAVAYLQPSGVVLTSCSYLPAGSEPGFVRQGNKTFIGFVLAACSEIETYVNVRLTLHVEGLSRQKRLLFLLRTRLEGDGSAPGSIGEA